MNRKKVVAISGSTRQNSTNHSLIKAIADLSAESLDITVYKGIVNLPQFNSDDDGENVAKEVSDFRQQLNNADWTISSSQFPHKPTMLITASTDGHYGHKALMETLKAIEAKNIDNLQMVIPFIKTKINSDNKITHDQTLEDLKTLIANFIKTINDK